MLYEDNHIIAVYKPAGMLSQGDKTGDISLFDEVKRYLKETRALKFQRNLVLGRALNGLSALEYKKPGKVFLGLLHRLDRPVSGIMLFAKTSKGASRLSEQFRNQSIEKTYQALVSGKPKEKKGVLVNRIKKIQQKASASLSGKEAVLYYEVVWQDKKYSLLKIQIESGKFHQIRAQLSLAGLPIVGDVKYGGEKWKDEKRIALEAMGLAFTTATGDKRINLSTGSLDFNELLMR